MIQSRLTTIGKMFLVLLILFYAAGITSQSGLLLLFIGLLAGCIGANWFYSRRMLQGLQVEAPKEVFIAEDSRSDRNWRITNGGKRTAEQIVALAPEGRLFTIPSLHFRRSISLLPSVVYARRGVYLNRFVRLSTAAPFGLVASTREIALEGEVVVYPRLYDTPVPPVSGLDMMSGGKLTGNRRVTHGAHFAGVRPWHPGDPIKQIHWKSTANRQQLMVKTFDEELSGRLALVISCEGAPAEMADDCVRAAGSLMFAALEAGHLVEFWDPVLNEFQKIPPFADGSELLLWLARFEPTELKPELIQEKASRKAALALVAARLGPAEQRIAGATNARKISLFLPAGTRQSKLLGESFWFDSNGIIPLPETSPAAA